MTDALLPARTLRLDQLAVGMRDSLRVDVTTEMVAAFAALSGDQAPLHTDEAFARARGYDGRVAHGLLVGAFVSRLIGTRLPGAGGVMQSVELSFREALVPPASITVEGEVGAISPATGQVKIKISVRTDSGRRIAEGVVRSIVKADA